MDISDDDLFLSDQELTDAPPATTSRNPVEEHLLKQLHDLTDRVEKAKSNLDHVSSLTDKISQKLHVRDTYGVSSDSDAESDCYQVTGEPVLKKKRTRNRTLFKLLEITNIWQQVIDDKWILGIALKNNSNRILVDPRLYIMIKDQKEIHGISSFWEIMDSLATRTDELIPEICELRATMVLDLPNFGNNDVYEAFGTISYVLDEKNLQTPVPTFRLRAKDVMDKNFAPKFSINKENTILAIKSICVERELSITIDKEGIGPRLFKFLEELGFNNVDDEIPDVYVAKSNEFWRHCIFEILPITETSAPVRISARTSSQLEAIVRLLRDNFPDVKVTDMEDILQEAVKALENEIKLELEGADAGALQKARMITDLLIP